jgi:hypothetical protein
VDAWTFIWLMVFLKIPIVALFLLVRWAIRQEPLIDPARPATDEDGGISVDPRGPRHPSHPRPRLPRSPRRGPHHGLPVPAAPRRVRAVVANARLTERIHA